MTIADTNHADDEDNDAAADADDDDCATIWMV